MDICVAAVIYEVGELRYLADGKNSRYEEYVCLPESKERRHLTGIQISCRGEVRQKT